MFVEKEEENISLLKRLYLRSFFLRTLPFSLPGFEIQQVTTGETTITIIAHAISPTATCPSWKPGFPSYA
jgi:hypothetical protein